MTPLQLPPYQIRLGGTRQKPTIFDMLRKKYVSLTPEEWVRQHFVHYLVEHKGYPAALMANEVRLPIGEKILRADTVLYNRELQPKMIIEYKAPHIAITQKVFEQIATYNMLLPADYLVVTNGLTHYVCRLKNRSKKYLYSEIIPNYEDI